MHRSSVTPVVGLVRAAVVRKSHDGGTVRFFALNAKSQHSASGRITTQVGPMGVNPIAFKPKGVSFGIPPPPVGPVPSKMTQLRYGPVMLHVFIVGAVGGIFYWLVPEHYFDVLKGMATGTHVPRSERAAAAKNAALTADEKLSPEAQPAAPVASASSPAPALAAQAPITAALTTTTSEQTSPASSAEPLPHERLPGEKLTWSEWFWSWGPYLHLSSAPPVTIPSPSSPADSSAEGRAADADREAGR
jgi:hypothetical protein